MAKAVAIICKTEDRAKKEAENLATPAGGGYKTVIAPVKSDAFDVRIRELTIKGRNYSDPDGGIYG